MLSLIIDKNPIKLLFGGLTTENIIKIIVSPNRENATKRINFLNSDQSNKCIDFTLVFFLCF